MRISTARFMRLMPSPSSASQAEAGVSLPAVWPSTIRTGARLQQPRQATSSTVNVREGSVSAPSGMAR